MQQASAMAPAASNGALQPFAHNGGTGRSGSDKSYIPNKGKLWHPNRMKIGDIISVDDTMQRGYQYKLVAPVGDVQCAKFKPYFSPKEMLRMGVFEGKYCTDCSNEFPLDWFEEAKFSNRPDPSINYFGVKSRQSLTVWQQKGWIFGRDPRGWFQWFCRYYLGRRLGEIDDIQIKRWRAFARHAGQVRANCQPADVFCRPRQRQALLQWSYDPLI
ncbi:hypothetical protein [Phaeobacter sp. 11ANDIMAR09]|uniref:hypothetical protein n=1 Tax=Phaeobacter sp. 11ANDIMAR09 TaxID=1225647 RepID=UPI00209F8C16|nr:hypothetical protein [Phaeobacter sp. 11ANDIMAR09]